MVACLQGVPLVHLMQICWLFPYNVLLTLQSFPNLGSADLGVPCKYGETFRKNFNKYSKSELDTVAIDWANTVISSLFFHALKSMKLS